MTIPNMGGKEGSFDAQFYSYTRYYIMYHIWGRTTSFIFEDKREGGCLQSRILKIWKYTINDTSRILKIPFYTSIHPLIEKIIPLKSPLVLEGFPQISLSWIWAIGKGFSVVEKISVWWGNQMDLLRGQSRFISPKNVSFLVVMLSYRQDNILWY